MPDVSERHHSEHVRLNFKDNPSTVKPDEPLIVSAIGEPRRGMLFFAKTLPCPYPAFTGQWFNVPNEYELGITNYELRILNF